MSTDRRESSLYKHKYRELVKAIEDIKSEITEYMNDCATTSVYTRLGFQTSLNVIDRHIGERSEHEADN